MITDTQYRLIVEAAKKSATGDAVGLWEIISHIKALMPTAKSAEVRRETIRAVERMLRNDGFIVGDVDPASLRFSAWSQEVGAAVARIEDDWTALGREPNLWEICWLARR